MASIAVRVILGQQWVASPFFSVDYGVAGAGITIILHAMIETCKDKNWIKRRFIGNTRCASYYFHNFTDLPFVGVAPDWTKSVDNFAISYGHKAGVKIGFVLEVMWKPRGFCNISHYKMRLKMRKHFVGQYV